MSRHRLRTEQIRAGVPLPFDTFDENGKLLLSRGYVIESPEQARRLVERGLYSNDAPQPEPGTSLSKDSVLYGQAPKGPRQIRISVHGLLDEAHAALFGLCAALPTDGSFPERLRQIALSVQNGCGFDADAALARNLVVRLRPHSIRHCLDTAILVELLLRQSQPDALLRLPAVCAALTMNIGALALHDRCYVQQEPLSDAQRAEVRAHPAASAEALARLGVDDALWLAAVAQHHESADGSGYPAGRKAPDIAAEACLIAVADRYCASVSERTHRAGKIPGIALQELLVTMSPQLDTKAASRLIREVGIYPPGALVTLANGETAIVVARTLNARQPVVRALTDANGKPRQDFSKRTTSEERFAIKGAVPRSRVTMELKMDLLWYPAVVDEPGADPVS